MYRVDRADDTLTLAELEGMSRCFADSIVRRYGIKPNDFVAILARDRVRPNDASGDGLLRRLFDMTSKKKGTSARMANEDPD